MKKQLLEHLPKPFVNVLVDMKYYLPSLFFSILPVKRNRIVITSFFGNDYGDNGKYIAEALLKIWPKADILWEIRPELMEDNHLPDAITPVAFRSLKAARALATAQVWIDNSRKTTAIHHRKGQLYIQTWHGAPGIKKCEGDSAAALDKDYVRYAKRDAAMTDIMVSNSQFTTDLYRRAFWYHGRILRCGSPRNDILCRDTSAIARKIRGLYGLPEDCRVLLYAPTFRSDYSLDMYDLDTDRVLDAFEKRFGGNWILFLRLHPNLYKAHARLQGDDPRRVNVTAYPDMQELLAASDALITDYSSSNIDYLLTGRPSFVYARDIQRYSQDRGYYFQFSELPFPVAADMDGLVRNVLDFDEKRFEKDRQAFFEMTQMDEKGTASETVAKYIRRYCAER